MTPREQELSRIYNATAGKDWIADGQLLVYCCLTGTDPKEVNVEGYEAFNSIGRKIPTSFKESAMALYKIAGTELNQFASQRLCAAIEAYLETLMTEPELAAFKASAPMKYPFQKFKSILEELEYAESH
jgi:hypothetical protein